MARAHAAKAVTIALDGTPPVSGLLQAPPDAHACYVLAHGAGAGMTHPFMDALAAWIESTVRATAVSSARGTPP